MGKISSKKKIKRIPAIITGTLQLLISIAFIILLYNTKLIPNNLLLLATGLILLISVVIILLLLKSRSCWSKVIAYILTVSTVILYLVGAGYLIKGIRTLNEITQVSVEHTDVGIYIKSDDSVNQMTEMADYTFGILDSLDRENTDKSIEEIKQTIGSDLNILTYPGLGELVDSLLVSGETDAIILNTAFIDILSDMEGYENTSEQLCEFHVQQVEEIVEIQEEVKEPEIVGEDTDSAYIFTMYISGIDSRNGLVSKSRSDVNILATVNTETKQVLLVSTPRDYYIPLSISNGIPDKLTHAGIYGVDVSMETLELLYNTEIDYYFRVNFSGFEQIIDALGGITVESDYAFSAKMFHDEYAFVQGINQLNGASALAFAHERYAFADGDRQRGRNQMKVIEAVINKALSPTLLTNYSAIMESVVGCFETNVSYDMIADVVKEQLSTGGNWNITSYSVSGSGASKKPYSLSTNAYVMVPDYETVEIAVSKIEQVKAGGILE